MNSTITKRIHPKANIENYIPKLSKWYLNRRQGPRTSQSNNCMRKRPRKAVRWKQLIQSDQKVAKSDPKLNKGMTRNATVDPKSGRLRARCHPKSGKYEYLVRLWPKDHKLFEFCIMGSIGDLFLSRILKNIQKHTKTQCNKNMELVCQRLPK